MKHAIIAVSMLVTCIVIAVINLVVSRYIGLNIFTIKVWFVVPVGALLFGFLATSGAVLAARHFSIYPTPVDLFVMVALAAATMFLIYYIDYATFTLADGRKASALMGFYEYVDVILTKAHLRVGRASRDAGQVGQMGYWLAVLEFAGFLVGGAGTFFFIKGLTKCERCGAYLSKLRSKTTPELTFDETKSLLHRVGSGDVATMEQALTWEPEPRMFGADEQTVKMTYDLHGCKGCNSQKVSAMPQVYEKGDWHPMPASAVQRTLDPNVSLIGAFT